jgi:hypothetical protein
MVESHLNQRFSVFFLLLRTGLFCQNIAVPAQQKQSLYSERCVIIINPLYALLQREISVEVIFKAFERAPLVEEH